MNSFIKVAFFLFIALGVNAQSVSLNIGGSISCESKITPRGSIVNVTRDGKPFTSFPISSEGTFFLYLPLGSEYSVKVTKKDFVQKIFSVNTKGVSQENAQSKFSVMIADLELMEFYPGVDFSLFDQPINKYYYNAQKDNFEYDKEYLKKMLALVAEVKEARKLAIVSAKTKAEQDKIEAALAKQQALLDERYATDAAALKKLEEELAQTKTPELKKFTDRSSYPNNNTATLPADIRTVSEVQPLAVDALQIISNKNEHLTALLIKYKNGVTEEIIIGKNLIIIQRVVVRDAMAWVYQKKIFNWGGVAFFRDGVAITEGIFEMETKTA